MGLNDDPRQELFAADTSAMGSALIALAGEEGEALSMDADEARDRVRAEDADLFRKRFGSAMSKHAKTIFDDYQGLVADSLVERAARQPPESPTFKEITVNGTGRTRVREACRRTNTR